VSADPCDEIRARALQIRQQGCSQCHAPPQNVIYNFVLDDTQLETMVPSGATLPLVVPGNPAGSLLLQKVQLGLSGDKLGMPPPRILAAGAGGISSALASTIVYPTPEDFSMLQAWVQSCVPGADGGAYSARYYGGTHGADGGGSNPDAAAAGAADAGRAPAAITTDEGHGPG